MCDYSKLQVKIKLVSLRGRPRECILCITYSEVTGLNPVFGPFSMTTLVFDYVAMTNYKIMSYCCKHKDYDAKFEKCEDSKDANVMLTITNYLVLAMNNK